jgi:hypothetical protein
MLIETTYEIIPPQGEIEFYSVKLEGDPGYKKLCQTLDPIFGPHQWEHVSVLWEEKPADMFVDENGRFKNLEFNQRASEIYWANWLMRFGDTPKVRAELISSPIGGKAVLFHRKVWF